MDRHITAPINKETARSLHAGDYVYITGTMYTARDAAHKRMYEILQVRQQQAEWINTHRNCWILDWEQWLEKAKETRRLSMQL